MDVTINISGLDELQRDLADLPRRVVKAFPKALAAGGAVIEGEIRKRTPRSVVETTSGKEYGPLVDALSSKVTTDEERLTGNVKVGFDDKGSGFTAVMVEFGHREVVNTGSTKSYRDSRNRLVTGQVYKDVGAVPAHPFIRPAGEAAEDGAVEAFTDSLLENLDK